MSGWVPRAFLAIAWVAVNTASDSAPPANDRPSVLHRRIITLCQQATDKNAASFGLTSHVAGYGTLHHLSNFTSESCDRLSIESSGFFAKTPPSRLSYVSQSHHGEPSSTNALDPGGTGRVEKADSKMRVRWIRREKLSDLCAPDLDPSFLASTDSWIALAIKVMSDQQSVCPDLCTAVAAAANDPDEKFGDLANNLATDVAPFLALFGEQVTKQYLSESTSFWDYFIFASAPIGIITTIVSAIRVRGPKWLKSFVGQSQEAAGVVEAELCSSTSHNVCEIFHNGGIARIIGRPKILEIIHFPRTPYHPGSPDRQPTAELNVFNQHLLETTGLAKPLDMNPARSTEWEFAAGSEDTRVAMALRVDGRQVRKALTRFIARMGKLGRLDFEGFRGSHLSISSSEKLMSSTSLVSACGAKLYSDILRKQNPPNLSINIGRARIRGTWIKGTVALGVTAQLGVFFDLIKLIVKAQYLTGPIFFWCGTLMLFVGMLWCAALIGQSTCEVTFRRRNVPGRETSRSALYWVQPGTQVVADQVFTSFAFSDAALKAKDSLSEYKISTIVDPDKGIKTRTVVAVLLTTFGYIFQLVGLRTSPAEISIAQLVITLLMTFVRGVMRTNRFKTRDNNLQAGVLNIVSGHELDWLSYELCYADDWTVTQESRKSSPISFSVLGTIQRPIPPGTESLHQPSSLIAVPSVSEAASPEAIHKQETIAGIENLIYYRQRLASFTSDPLVPDFQRWDDAQVKVRSISRKIVLALNRADAILAAGQRCSEIEMHLNITYPGMRFLGQLPDSNVGVFKPGSTWTAETVEALLGLWVWSLKSNFNVAASEDTDKPAIDVLLAEHIALAHIVSFRPCSCEDIIHQERDEGFNVNYYHPDFSDLVPWFGEDSILNGFKMNFGFLRIDTSKWTSAGAQFDPSTMIWRRMLRDRDCSVWEACDPVFPHIRPADDLSSYVRFTGWTSLWRPKTKLVVPKSGMVELMYITPKTVELQPNFGLVECCARDLFIALLRHWFDGQKPSLIRRFRERLAPRSKDSPHFHLQNSTISSICQVFSECGLGSESHALFSLVPALQEHIDISNGEGILVTLFKDVANCKGSLSTWSDAHELLSRAYRNFLPPASAPEPSLSPRSKRARVEYIRQIAIAEGELLRRALFPTNSVKVRAWGFSRIEAQYSPHYNPHDRHGLFQYLRAFLCWEETRQRYRQVAQILAPRDKDLRGFDSVAFRSGSSEYASSALPRRSLATKVKEPSYRTSREVESRNAAHRAAELDLAVKSNDRVGTLVLLNDPDIPVSFLDVSILPRAAEKGWTEVVLSLLDAGADPCGMDEDRKSTIGHYTDAKNGAMASELLSVVQGVSERRRFEE
ncbi:hypothetical protein QBC34DRAFT_468663 [Podospora aff. communis PSN243]|uniref:Ankyrin repeat protein n=1 Tax=Podospora aff. communis PSN243 TaxID=3040156 RepID=A0AAV9GFN5_9PEZI|nr:hypothetical protein QBC34DRAFT_468663 [Podospora aff. communis PSN243]